MPKHTKGPWRRKGSKYVIRAAPDPGSHLKPTDLQIVVQVRANQKYRTGKYDEENAALIEDAPAMWLALELIRLGVAALTQDGKHFVFDPLGKLKPPLHPFPVTGTWTELIDAIGWDRCYALLEAQKR